MGFTLHIITFGVALSFVKWPPFEAGPPQIVPAVNAVLPGFYPTPMACLHFWKVGIKNFHRNDSKKRHDFTESLGTKKRSQCSFGCERICFITGGYNNPLAVKYYSQVSARPRGYDAACADGGIPPYHLGFPGEVWLPSPRAVRCCCDSLSGGRRAREQSAVHKRICLLQKNSIGGLGVVGEVLWTRAEDGAGGDADPAERSVRRRGGAQSCRG